MTAWKAWRDVRGRLACCAAGLLVLAPLKVGAFSGCARCRTRCA